LDDLFQYSLQSTIRQHFAEVDEADGVSALGCGLAWSWNALLVFRFIGGLGVGGSSVLGPMYIAEIAPAKWRGRLVGVFQINIVVGILLAYLSNYLITRAAFAPEDWRWMLGVSGVPALFFFAMLFTIPRSPRWLMQKGRRQEAHSTLQQVGEQNVEAELDDIARSIDIEHGHAIEPLFSRKYATPIFLAVSIAAFNQLSGINVNPPFIGHMEAHKKPSPDIGIARDYRVTESIGLKLPGIVRVARHMVRTDRQAELHISKNSHNLEKIHLSFVGVHFREVVKASADITHMDLMYFAPITQVLDNGENFRGRFF
jgi:hypothetical protein